MEMIYSIVDFSRTKKISDHFYIRIHPSDIRKNNINMDITVIKRKSKHGIHVDRTSDQQRNVEKLS